MNPKQFWQRHDRATVEAICEKAGTSFLNFRQIALYKNRVSPRLARKLTIASAGAMTEMEIIYKPEDGYVGD